MSTPPVSEVARTGREAEEAMRSAVDADNVRPAVSEDAIDGVQASCVVAPGSMEEVSGVLRVAHDRGLAVTPRGAGSKMTWGNIPSRLNVIVSTDRMAHVQEHAVGDLVARVETGARLQDLQAVLRQSGQWLAIDPPEPNATIGGIIASNSSGPHRLRYGTMRDLLIGITYVLADGTVAKAGGRVVKNVAGYDLCKLFTGSMGTLGLVVEAIVRLHPIPECSRTVAVMLDDFAAMGDACQQILNSSLVPSALEFRWQQGAGELMALFEGVERGVEAQAKAAVKMWFAQGDVVIGSEMDTHLGSADVELAVSTPIGELPAVLGDVERHARELSVDCAVSAQAGSGIGRVDMKNGDVDTIVQLVRLTREAAARCEGSVTVRRVPLEVKRQIDVWGEQEPSSLKLMRSVKARFDPKALLNPGRFVGRI